MSESVIYNGHLQIVESLEEHERLKEVLLESYPTATIVTSAVLKLFHTEYDRHTLDKMDNNNPNAVWYYLPSGSHGAKRGDHCNGMQFSPVPGHYASFPHINFNSS